MCGRRWPFRLDPMERMSTRSLHYLPGGDGCVRSSGSPRSASKRLVGILRRHHVSHTKWNMNTRDRGALKVGKLVVEVYVWL